MIGIYKITNLLNGKVYIGQSINIVQRLNRHKNYDKRYSHYPLYQAFNKEGIENFSFEVLEECDINSLNEREKFWIKYYNSFHEGYNQTEGGAGSPNVIIKLSHEDVMIIYDLLQHSDISQQEIAKQFNVGQDTISEINQGKTRIQSGYTYPLRNNKKQKNYCIDCGAEIGSTSMRCLACNAKDSRTVQRPSREELKQLIRTTPFTRIGKQFNVSDNTIRKWCDAEGLPKRASEIKKFTEEEWKAI